MEMRTIEERQVATLVEMALCGFEHRAGLLNNSLLLLTVAYEICPEDTICMLLIEMKAYVLEDIEDIVEGLGRLHAAESDGDTRRRLASIMKMVDTYLLSVVENGEDD